MKKFIYVLLPVALVVFFSLLPTPNNNELPAQQSAELKFGDLTKNFIISNTRIYDGNNLLEKASIIVKQGKVSEIITGEHKSKADIPTIAGNGYTILPGLIDAHTHTWGSAAEEALNFGVATELDMFTLPAGMSEHILLRDKSTNTTQADVFSAMYLATAPDGHGTQFGIDVPVLETVEQVPEFVAKRIAEGASYIKAVYFSERAPRQYFPSINLDILTTLASEANKNGLKLVVHIDDLISAKEAIQVGANGLVHSFINELADDEVIKMMRDNSVFIVPTLSVLASASAAVNMQLTDSRVLKPYLNRIQRSQLEQRYSDTGLSKEYYQRALQNVLKLHKAGIVILAGSDAPNPGTTHGVSLHEELLRLVAAGLNEQQAIHAATGAASKVMPIGSRGTLSIGEPATMLLVKGNPFVNIEDTQAISGIWKHGVPMTRQKAVDNEISSNEIKPMTISLLQKNEQTGSSQVVLTSDQMMNGQSTGHIEYADTNNYLLFKGEIKTGYMFPWTGVSLLFGDNAEQVFDLRQANVLSISAKSATPDAKLTILLIKQGLQRPFMHELPLSDDWQEYKIDLSEISGVDLSQIVNISLVFMNNPGEYELYSTLR